MTDEKNIFDLQLAERMKSCPVLAVLMIDNVEHALPLAEALYEGGIKAMELTLRTDAALEAARIISSNVPEMILGIGTVLTPDQVKEAKEAGADFAVSPGLNPRVLQAAQDEGLSFAPGIMTPSDIEAALEFNCQILKYFPAETAGGLKHLRNIAAPYIHRKISFIPLGGVNGSNMAEYLSDPLIHSIGGSWIAPRKLIQQSDWQTIKDNARKISAEAVKLAKDKL